MLARFKEFLQDVGLNISGVGQSPSDTSNVWVGVAERAEQLGYPTELVTKHRALLGKWIAKHKLTSRCDKRLSINIYLLTDALDDCITEYLDAMKALNS